MTLGRLRLIRKLRSLVSAAVLGIFLMLSGGILALADGLVELRTQMVAGLHSVDSALAVTVTEDSCPVCPHSHHSDADPACCCGHFHSSPTQVITLTYSPRLSKHEFSDICSFPPDVFFERFVPPQNQG